MMYTMASLGVLLVAAAAEPRVADLHISVRSPTGAPLVGAHLTGTTTSGTWKAGTDEDGVARVRVAYREDSERIYVRLAQGPWLAGQPSLPTSEHGQRVKAFGEELDRSYWPKAVEAIVVPASNGANQVIATIRASEPTHVRGTIVSSNGEVMNDALAVVRSSANAIRLTKQGVFDVIAARGIAGELELIVSESRLLWVSWPAGRATEDLDLGQVLVPTFGTTGTVRAEVVGRSAGDPRLHSGSLAGITLIREDASFGISLHGDGSKIPHVKPGDPLPDLSSFIISTVTRAATTGTYFVAPGAITLTECGTRIRDAIRAGEDVEAKWGVPRVVVEAGKETVFTFDAEKVYKAVMGKLPPVIDLRKSALVEDKPAGPAEKPTDPKDKPGDSKDSGPK
jgi:hypothetical protein